jgi:hypothetical protein
MTLASLVPSAEIALIAEKEWSKVFSARTY